jgi:hypothetical protein
VTGPSGDFVKADHHVTNGTTTEIVTNAACVVCHGDLQVDLNHPSGTLPAAPNVQLMNPDSAGTYVATTPAGIELVCSGCHDSNGATRLGSNALTPFNASAPFPDTTRPPDIGWTAAQQAHSVNGSYGGCLACHGNAGTANAHGSSSAKIMKYPYSTAIAAYNVDNTSNFCYNCHGATPANGTTKDVGTDFAKAYGHQTVTCFDCHDQHMVKTGSHTNATTLAGVLNGATGKGVTTWNAANWGGVTTYSSVAAATAEWKVCFKCHSGASLPAGTGAAAYTDLGLEFNPNNASYHPVIQALTTGTANHRQLAAGALTGGWAPGSVMTCTDCHATDTAASKGPHGSAVKWMLNPNTTATKYTNWPFTTAAANGTASGGTLINGTGSATLPNGGTVFCLSCHVWSGGGAAHTQRSGDHNVPCVSCHIRVPHGGKIYRLMTSPNAPARYKPDGNGGGTVNIVTVRGNFTSGTLGESDVQTSCGQHGSAPASPTAW